MISGSGKKRKDWLLLDCVNAEMSDFSIRIALLALVFGAWLMARPYYGIWHDSVLYTVQALNVLSPEIYSNDLFFRFGSQESFTLFPSVHAWFISLLGIEKAALYLTILGKVAWFAGLLFFSSAFLRGWPLWLGLAVVATYPPFFEGKNVLSYGESFVTSRLFAEALVLAAIGLFLRRCAAWIAVCILIGAALLHPLVTLPGMQAMGFLKRWKTYFPLMAMAIGLSAVVLLLAVIGVNPFARLLLVFDPEWFDVVAKSSPLVFIETWNREAFGRVAFLAVLLLAAYRWLNDESRHVAQAMFGLSVVSLLAAWLGSVVVHNVLITQLQFLRALWLVQISALLLLGGLTQVFWRGTANQRVLLVILWCALLLQGLSAGILAVVGLINMLLVERFMPNWKPSSFIQGLLALIVVFALIHKGVYWITVLSVVRDRPAWPILLSDTVPVVMIIGAVVWLSPRFAIAARTTSLVGTGMLILGMLTWDMSDTNTVFKIPIQTGDASALQSIIPITAVVFWPNGLLSTWFWLERTHYANRFQAAGNVFSRGTALEAKRRQQLLWAQGFKEGFPDWAFDPVLNTKENRSHDPEVASELCQDIVLDYLILPSSNHRASVAIFTDSSSGDPRELIDCQKLRRLDSSINMMSKYDV